MRIPLPIHSYKLRSTQASPSRIVNCFAEQMPPDAKAEVLLTRSHGVSSWSTVGTGDIHALHAAHGYLYVVTGTKLYRVATDLTATELGDVGAFSNIDIDSNASSVVVVNEPNAYYWNGSSFAQITDADFTSRGAGDVEFVNNYLLFREPDSGRFFGADLGSATSFDALNFATAEGSPDEMVGFKVDHLQAILLGETTLEVWDNDPNAGSFPFVRAVNGFAEIGCLNGRSVAKLDNSIFWLAHDYTVRRLDGITPVRVSTHAIEQRIHEMTISSAKGYGYSIDGHLFYLLSFDQGSFVYDATTGLWHERQTYGEERWNWEHPVSFNGLVLVGDSASNQIGYLDGETYADYGDIQRMEWTYQPIVAEGRRAFHHRLEMEFEAGVGLTTGQGSAPEIMCDYSDDGGKTWVTLPNRSLGAIGEYRNRVVWHGLGSARQRVYRGAVSDPVQVTLAQTFVEATGGRL